LDRRRALAGAPFPWDGCFLCTLGWRKRCSRRLPTQMLSLVGTWSQGQRRKNPMEKVPVLPCSSWWVLQIQAHTGEHQPPDLALLPRVCCLSISPAQLLQTRGRRQEHGKITRWSCCIISLLIQRKTDLGKDSPFFLFPLFFLTQAQFTAFPKPQMVWLPCTSPGK